MLTITQERRRIKCREYTRLYRLRHPDRVKAYAERRRALCPEAGAEASRRHRAKKLEANPRFYADRQAAWREAHPNGNRAIMRRWKKKRYDSDPGYRARQCVSARISKLLSAHGLAKGSKTEDILGATIHVVRAHLESKFLPGMTWANHGKFGWHIDHVKPCASFDLTVPEQLRACFHYTNLQPLWWRDNLSKGCRS